MSKPRIQLRLTERLETVIRAEAERLDVSFGEVVRRALDQLFPPEKRSVITTK